MTLLERLADQKEILNMPMSDKLVATLYVTILGMGITFLVLIFLQYCIVFMSWMLNRKKHKEAVEVKESNVSLERPVPVIYQPEQEDEELIAVITAAVAACMGRTAESIVVRNILRVQDGTPNWAKAGLVEQMNLRQSH